MDATRFERGASTLTASMTSGGGEDAGILLGAGDHRVQQTCFFDRGVHANLDPYQRRHLSPADGDSDDLVAGRPLLGLVDDPGRVDEVQQFDAIEHEDAGKGPVSGVGVVGHAARRSGYGWGWLLSDRAGMVTVEASMRDRHGARACPVNEHDDQESDREHGGDDRGMVA